MMTQKSTILTMENVDFSFGRRQILDNVSLVVQPRDFLAIIGPNGGGKTTFLKLMMGLISPQKGHIKLFNDHPKKTRHFVGYLPQHSSYLLQYPISVLEVVLMNCLTNRPFHHYTKEEIQKAKEQLAQLGVEHLEKTALTELSGGESQRVFLARALMNDPKLLILDEPTSNIDHKGGHAFFEHLAQLNKTVTIILISHDLTAVANTVKQIACLNKKLIYHGSKELSHDDLEATYGCPIDLIAHGTPHRTLRRHDH